MQSCDHGCARGRGGGQWVSAECDGAARCLGRLLYRNKNLKALPSTLGNLKKLETL